jgi:hypothetical protein
MGEQERLDAVAAGTVAMAGIIHLCHELAARELLSRKALDRLNETMLAALEASKASPLLQAQLHQALAYHFANAYRDLPPEPPRASSQPE